jgi:phosphohistidine swiveling domain-containing protein
MKILRPTVKRDLSLFSVEAWQQGYVHYLKQSLGFSYPIIFYYDGVKVNFYHLQEDFNYFKQTITSSLIQDENLFLKLNHQFLSDVKLLISLNKRMNPLDLPRVFNLIGKIMSFYIFVVGDSFVQAKPEVWESRKLSERILYEVDEKVAKLIQELLQKRKQNPDLAHYLRYNEIRDLLSDNPISVDLIKNRKSGYIIIGKKLTVQSDFDFFCQKHHLINPEGDQKQVIGRELIGQPANSGLAKGPVIIINRKEDLARVKRGAVVVSVMTNVHYLTAAKKASAIITDEGGVTCHAAIIAREIRKPCIVGTKIATKVLKDGDLVEVDADHGIIKRLNNYD